MVSGRRSGTPLGQRLERLGFNMRTFAAFIGVSDVTVRRWSFPSETASHVPIPTPVARLLDLLEEVDVPRPSQDPDGLSIAALRFSENWLQRTQSQGWQKTESARALIAAIEDSIKAPPDL